MSKKKNRPHGHYCKICGEYKANEKFSGKGHAAHICKACSRLSAAEKAAAMDINRLMDFPMRRLSESEKKWLKAKMKDECPEVADTAREIYNVCFPHAERNAMKKQLVINRAGDCCSSYTREWIPQFFRRGYCCFEKSFCFKNLGIICCGHP